MLLPYITVFSITVYSKDYNFFLEKSEKTFENWTFKYSLLSISAHQLLQSVALSVNVLR